MTPALRILTAITLACLPCSAQQNRDDLTPLEIHYTTTVPEGAESISVGIDIHRVNGPILHLAMPSWAPGSYRQRDYAASVENLVVEAAGEIPLEATRIDDDTWSVATGGHRTIHVSYDLPAPRSNRFTRRSRSDDTETTGFSMAGPGTYMYVRGAKGTPVTSTYVLPEGWRVANGLIQTEDPFVRWAKDYDTFIDAPSILGHFEERSFEVAGTPIHCVFFENEQEYDFDIDAFVDIVRLIVENQGALFETFPFPDYWFLFSMPGGGGLEHLNSTSIGLRAESQKRDPEAGASVTSHEFFHTWNVKRIRPVALGPFDYQRENYTGNLWVSEGWTSYFGTLTLARVGVLDRDEYLAHLERIIDRELNKERRKEHSVYWASRNVWHRYQDEEGSRVDYYAKGELLGALIDLSIRHHSGGRKSLNDVMRFMNRWFAERGVGFEEGDVERACTAISNHDFAEFFARHIYGTLDPPVAEILSYAGIDYEAEMIECAFPFSVRGNRVSGRRDEEANYDEIPEPGETIEMVDGVDFESSRDVLREHAAGDTVTLTLVNRDDEERQLEVTLVAAKRLIPRLSFSENPTPAQLAVRDPWLTSVD